ncbi:MAG: hypothetical protein ABSF24_02410 [Candidatus Bathyarchaeia archaeon]|jgi:hypothetical protein
MSLIEIVRARIRARLQAPISRVQSRGQSVSRLEPQKPRPVALFGANPNEAFALDWASYSVPQVKGVATQPQPLQNELKSVDGDASLERWVPDPSRPSLTSHGRALNYNATTDQKAIVGFRGGETTSDHWDGEIRNVVQKPDFQGARSKKEPTAADLAERDLKAYPFDFTV